MNMKQKLISKLYGKSAFILNITERMPSTGILVIEWLSVNDESL
jgi:hypothetical protein